MNTRTNKESFSTLKNGDIFKVISNSIPSRKTVYIGIFKKIEPSGLPNVNRIHFHFAIKQVWEKILIEEDDYFLCRENNILVKLTIEDYLYLTQIMKKYNRIFNKKTLKLITK